MIYIYTDYYQVERKLLDTFDLTRRAFAFILLLSVHEGKQLIEHHEQSFLRVCMYMM